MGMDTIAVLTAAGVLFAAWLRATAPILLAALGTLVSDLAGVVNVGIEGLMLVAAFFGVIGSAFAPMWLPGSPAWAWPLVGAALGLLSAVVLALLLGVFHLEFGADIIVAGIGINLLAAGLTVFLMVTVSGDKGSTASLTSYVLPNLHIPGLGAWPMVDAWINGDGGAGHHVLIYTAALAVVAVTVGLYRTRFGKHLRAVGENRDAAIAAGISVKAVQYGALCMSGVLAGLGGVYLSMGYLTLFQADMSAGRGFLGLAAIFLGARRPLGTVGAALLFGASTVLGAQLGLFNIPSQVIYMIPPLVTLVTMGFVMERRSARKRLSIQHAMNQLRHRSISPNIVHKEEFHP